MIAEEGVDILLQLCSCLQIKKSEAKNKKRQYVNIAQKRRPRVIWCLRGTISRGVHAIFVIAYSYACESPTLNYLSQQWRSYLIFTTVYFTVEMSFSLGYTK